MAKFNDLGSRVFYAVLLGVAGILCLLTKLSAELFIYALLYVFMLEVNNHPIPSAKALLVTAAFMLVVIVGFICAIDIRTSKHGFCNLLIVALGVCVSDMGAYFGGKKFGRTKLAPKISPKKTVEGLICGLACGAIALLALWWPLRQSNDTSLSFIAVMLAVIVLLPIAVLGDLLESWSKRLLGIKDFSNTLGAHGGIADRFDALAPSLIVLELILSIAS